MFEEPDSVPETFSEMFPGLSPEASPETFPETSPKTLGILGHYYLCKEIPKIFQRSEDGMININSSLLIKEVLKYGFIAGIAGSTIILYIDPSKKSAGGN